jgi:hypothetical protein
VRYALQVAIMRRVPGHIEPIAPMVYNDDFHKFISSLLDKEMHQLAEEITADFYRSSHHPEAHPEIKQLCELIKKIAQPDQPAGGSGDGLQRDQILFLLQHKNITVVMEALNRMEYLARPKYDPCATYLEHYNSLRDDGNKVPFEPRDLQTLNRWKKECALAVRRDFLVSWRRCIRDKRESEGDDQESPMGFDIALGDDFPDHVTAALFNEEALGNHEQLIRGLIWPLTTVEPPKNWLEWSAESDNEQRLDGDVEIGPETSSPAPKEEDSDF